MTFEIEGEVTAVVTITEQGDGTLLFEIDQTSADGSLADLRALYFDLADDSLAKGLSVTGDDVTDSAFKANKVSGLGNDTGVKGQVLKEAGRFDGGVEFGTQGLGKDDVRSTSFTLSHEDQALTLDLFSLQDFAVRMTSVGQEGDREGSLKLGGTAADASLADPVEDAPVEDAPVEDTPIEDAPVEDAPVEEAPVEGAPVEDAPTSPPADEPVRDPAPVPSDPDPLPESDPVLETDPVLESDPLLETDPLAADPVDDTFTFTDPVIVDTSTPTFGDLYDEPVTADAPMLDEGALSGGGTDRTLSDPTLEVDSGFVAEDFVV